MRVTIKQSSFDISATPYILQNSAFNIYDYSVLHNPGNKSGPRVLLNSSRWRFESGEESPIYRASRCDEGKRCWHAIRWSFRTENPVRLGGSFPLVKPIIVAVTSRLLTGLVLERPLHTRGTYTYIRPAFTCVQVKDCVCVCVCVETHIVLEQGDTRRWDKPRFDHCAMVLRFYYGGHILMGHYLNTLYPDSRSVSYSLGMWKKEKSIPSNLSFSFFFRSSSFSTLFSLLLPFPFERRDASVHSSPLLVLPSVFSTAFSLCFWSIVRENARLDVNRYRGYFHVCWITRSSKSDRLAKFRWGWTIHSKEFL